MGVSRKSIIRCESYKTKRLVPSLNNYLANGRIFQTRNGTQMRQTSLPNEIIERSNKLHTVSIHHIPKFFKSKYGYSLAPPKKNLNLKVYELSDDESFCDSGVSFILHFKRQIHFNNKKNSRITQCLKRLSHKNHDKSLEILESKVKNEIKKKKVYSIRKSNFLDNNVERCYPFDDESCEQLDKNISVQCKLIDDIPPEKFETKIKQGDRNESCEISSKNDEEENKCSKLIEKYKLLVANSCTDNDIYCDEFDDVVRKDPTKSEPTAKKINHIDINGIVKSDSFKDDKKPHSKMIVSSNVDQLKKSEAMKCRTATSDDAVVPITPKKKVIRRKISDNDSIGSRSQSLTNMNDVDVNLYDYNEMTMHKDAIDQEHLLCDPLKKTSDHNYEDFSDENLEHTETYTLFEDQFQDDMLCCENFNLNSACAKDDNIQEEHERHDELYPVIDTINIVEHLNSKDFTHADDSRDDMKSQNNSILVTNLNSLFESITDINACTCDSQNDSFYPQTITERNEIDDKKEFETKHAHKIKNNDSYNVDQGCKDDQNLMTSSMEKMDVNQIVTNHVTEATNFDSKSNVKKNKPKVTKRKKSTKNKRKIKKLNETSLGNNELSVMIKSHICKSKDNVVINKDKCVKSICLQPDDLENPSEIKNTSENVNLQVMDSGNTIGQESDKHDEVKIIKKDNCHQEHHRVTLSDPCTLQSVVISSHDYEIVNDDIISSSVNIDHTNLDKNKSEINSKSRKGKWSVKYVKKKKGSCKNKNKSKKKDTIKQELKQGERCEANVELKYISNVILGCNEVIDLISPERTKTIQLSRGVADSDVPSILGNAGNNDDGDNDDPCYLNESEMTLNDIGADSESVDALYQDIKSSKNKKQKKSKKRQKKVLRKKSINISKKVVKKCDKEFKDDFDVEKPSIDKSLDLNSDLQDSSDIETTNINIITPHMPESLPQMTENRFVETNSRENEQNLHTINPEQEVSDRFAIEKCQTYQNNSNSPIASKETKSITVKASKAEFRVVSSSPILDHVVVVADKESNATKCICKSSLGVIHVSECLERVSIDFNALLSSLPEENHESFYGQVTSAERLSEEFNANSKTSPEVSSNFGDISRNNYQENNEEIEDKIINCSQNNSTLKSSVSKFVCFPSLSDNSEFDKENPIPQKRRRVSFAEITVVNVFNNNHDDSRGMRLQNRDINNDRVALVSMPLEKSKTKSILKVSRSTVSNYVGACVANQSHDQLSQVIIKSSKSVIVGIFIDDFTTRMKLLRDFIRQQEEHPGSLVGSEESSMRDSQKDEDMQHLQNEADHMYSENPIIEYDPLRTDGVESLCKHWLSPPLIQKEQESGWADHLYSNP